MTSEDRSRKRILEATGFIFLLSLWNVGLVWYVGGLLMFFDLNRVGLRISEVWFWVFAFPLRVVELLGLPIFTNRDIFYLALGLNAIVYGVTWYGAGRGFAWLFLRKPRLDSDDERELPRSPPVPRNPWG